MRRGRRTAVWVAASLAVTACGPFVQVAPRAPASRAVIGGLGGLDLSDYSAGSSDDRVSALGVSWMLREGSLGTSRGREQLSGVLEGEQDGGKDYIFLGIEAEAWDVYDEGLLRGARLRDLAATVSWQSPWGGGQRLLDSRAALGVGLFFNRASIGQQSSTSLEWTGGGVQVSGEYELRLGAGDSWGLTGFVGGRGQIGLAEPGDSLGSNYDSTKQLGLSAQVGLRYRWQRAFLQLDYRYRQIEFSDASDEFGPDLPGPSFDFDGALISFGLTW